MSVPRITPPQIYPQYDRDISLPGVLAPTLDGWNAVTGVFTAGRAYYGRFVPSRNMTITTLAFVVTSAAASNDNVEVGLYDAAGGRLVTSGPVAGKLNSTGVQTITITSTTLTAGAVYYAAFCYPSAGGTAATLLFGTLGSVDATKMFGATVPNRLFGFQTIGALPTTAGLNDTTSCIAMAIRES